MATGTDWLDLYTPQNGDHTRLWDHFESQNESIETALLTLFAKTIKIRNTADGYGITSHVLIAPAVTIPASPYGPGIPYSIDIIGTAKVESPGGSAVYLEAAYKETSASTWQPMEGLQQSTPALANLAPTVIGHHRVTNPDVSMQVCCRVLGSSSSQRVLNDELYHVKVRIYPSLALA